MKYTILVMGPPYGTENAISAFLFSKNLIHFKIHSINSVFFYCNGIYNSNKFLYSSIDEENLVYSWCRFSKKFSINLHVCSNAAYVRGVIDDNLALDLGFSDGNLHKSFHLTGLGTLVSSILKSDRLVQF
ncbi:sulfurtransferase complex subunit TusD [Buchnera aphidicola]|uniref:sulfurtransferase complex subunit TusD n=1 Tax=Buchnera aphidicola TaxID=9 RepID=UPI0034644DD1